MVFRRGYFVFLKQVAGGILGLTFTKMLIELSESVPGCRSRLIFIFALSFLVLRPQAFQR